MLLIKNNKHPFSFLTIPSSSLILVVEVMLRLTVISRR